MYRIPIDHSITTEYILIKSQKQPIVIFKHSTRCSISSMALERLNRFDSKTIQKPTKYYYVDILNFRDISNEIATQLKVVHESPQLIIVHNGKAIYDASHSNISSDQILRVLENIK